MALWENFHPGLQETGIPVLAPQCGGQYVTLSRPRMRNLITSAHSLGLFSQLLLQCIRGRNKENENVNATQLESVAYNGHVMDQVSRRS